MTKVDYHRYDEAWERDALEVLPQVYGSPRPLQQSLLSEISLKPQHLVLDLRKAEDFRAWHLPESINLPLVSVSPDIPSPFSDPAVLEAQWLELEKIFSNGTLAPDLGNAHVLVMCYDGDTARVATSVLRAKGFEADSMRGGHTALKMTCTALAASPPPQPPQPSPPSSYPSRRWFPSPRSLIERIIDRGMQSVGLGRAM